MDIKILHLVEGAKKAKGCAVIIDVLRAFSTSCYVFANGADKIIPVGDIDKAYSLKQENPHYVLIGERHGKKPEGFDFGNSPSEIKNIDFSGKIVVLTTTAGTQGIVNAVNADEIIPGCFLNVNSIIKYILKSKPKTVSLVCIGFREQRQTTEDMLCAEYIKNALEGKSNNFSRIVEKVRESEGCRGYNDPKITWLPKSDFDLCMKLDKFDFLIKSRKVNNQIEFFKISP
jgi:2-phosphosulfolactate phosphatase